MNSAPSNSALSKLATHVNEWLANTFTHYVKNKYKPITYIII